MSDPLSLCLIVKNEERNLPRCLDAVRGLAGEVIVVDTGSTDRTPAIAADCGAKVIPFDFATVDFAAARNHAIGHATGRWILMLDADETLDRAGAPMIERLIALDENAGYYLERLNHGSDSASSTTDYVVRLFPNRPNYRYRGRVHETVDAAILSGGGRLRKTGIRINHNFAADREARRRKNHWYIEILKEEIAADPGDDSRLDFLAAEFHQLEMFEEATEIAERIVRMRPLDPTAHLYVGIYHLLYKPDPVRARADFHQALKLRPGYPEAQSFLDMMEQRERVRCLRRKNPTQAGRPVLRSTGLPACVRLSADSVDLPAHLSYTVGVMSKIDSLGQFEQLVLTAILTLGDDAYGVTIHSKAEELARPKAVSLGAVYVTLDRLEDKRLVSSWLSDPTPERGGRSKRCYRLEALGERALRESALTAKRIWDVTTLAWGKEWGRRWGKELG